MSRELVSVRDLAEDVEIDGNGDGSDDETVKRTPLSKKPNWPTRYLTALPSGKRWVSLDSFGYDWNFQLKILPKWLQAKFASITNWAFVRSAQPMSSLNAMLHQLSNHNFWAPVLLWVAQSFWAWHFSTDCSFTECTTILSDPSISLRLLFLHQVFICGTHVLARATLVLQVKPS